MGTKEIAVAVPVMVNDYTGTGTDRVILEMIMGTQKGEAINYYGLNIAESLDSDQVGIVTGMCFGAFEQKERKKELTSVVIPDSVTSIDSYAFFQNLFNSITICESVQIADNLLRTNNNFRTAYTMGSPGT